VACTARESRDHMRARHAGRPTTFSCSADHRLSKSRISMPGGAATEIAPPGSKRRRGDGSRTRSGNCGVTSVRHSLPVPHSSLHHFVYLLAPTCTPCPPHSPWRNAAERTPRGRPDAGRRMKSSSAYACERGHLLVVQRHGSENTNRVTDVRPSSECSNEAGARGVRVGLAVQHRDATPKGAQDTVRGRNCQEGR
jgi:hypothetical protein